ncbi:hypothetical protein ACFL3F_03420, partial [Planctomycetota bacterium]
MMHTKLPPIFVLTLGFVLCASIVLSAEKKPYGLLEDGRTVDLYTLKNQQGMEARIITYGAILVSLEVPDRNGKLDDIILGWDTLDDYVKHKNSGGSIAGRHAGYIANGRYTWDGVEYQLSTNARGGHVHGGINGFATRLWT